MNSTEAQAVIALLSVLFPQPGQPHIPQGIYDGPAVESSPVSAPITSVAAVTAVAPQPEPSPEPARRGRRTKAQIEADAAAAANPTQAAAAGAEPQATTESVKTTAADKGSADVSPSGATNGTLKVVSADELRTLLNTYIQKHSMEEAITVLKNFNCNRVTEALSLDPAKLNELAGQLNA
ncbi:MAG TPA: hypothetical protein VMQ76_05325 [Terracidiphilus sp.]|nr:hypothetical protein [Terracidiphilus sp.]